MNLTSFSFLAFGLLIIFLYYILPNKLKWPFILITSICFLFYNNFELIFIAYVLVILLTSYIGALLIERFKETKYASRICLLSILIILFQLIYLKYTNLFGNIFESIINLFGGSYSYQEVYRSSPLGITYYTLIMIGYIVGVYRGESKAQKNIFKCALFMTYFPQLISGPFTRYKDMESELYKAKKYDFNKIKNGILRIIWGFFKILVISTRMGILVDSVYGNLEALNGIWVFIACLFYTLQLYTNFSGSIDIMMGVSECLGIKLPENFQNPFFSKSIAEFWRRWHITLGAWLRDFIFYPLLKSNFIQNLTTKTKKAFGKKWGKKIPVYISMLILWILIGAWHGGAYHYILASGILQFIYILCEELTEPLSKKIITKLKINTDSIFYKLTLCFKTFLLFSLSMIFFRAVTVTKGINIFKAMFSFNFNFSLLNLTGLNIADIIVVIISLIILFGVELMQRSGSVREKLAKQNVIIRYSLIYALILIILIFGIYGIGFDASEFIYSKF